MISTDKKVPKVTKSLNKKILDGNLLGKYLHFICLTTQKDITSLERNITVFFENVDQEYMIHITTQRLLGLVTHLRH